MSMYLIWVILRWDLTFSFSTSMEEADIGKYPSLTLFSPLVWIHFVSLPLCRNLQSSISSFSDSRICHLFTYLVNTSLFRQCIQRYPQGNCRPGSSTTPIKLWFWVICTPSLPLLNFRYLLCFIYLFYALQ